MKKQLDSDHNWSIKFSYDRSGRPSGLTVRLKPAYWLPNRKGKRAKLSSEILKWLADLEAVIRD